MLLQGEYAPGQYVNLKCSASGHLLLEDSGGLLVDQLPLAIGQAATSGSLSVCFSNDFNQFVGTLPMTTSTVSTVVAGQKSLTAAGTAQQVTTSATAITNSVTIQADESNGGILTFGGATVNSTITGAGNGFMLKPGQRLTWTGKDLSALYFNGTVTGDFLSYIGN